MYKPTKSAMGIVQAIVNVPHELPGTRRTEPLGKAYRSNPAGGWKGPAELLWS
jgi:hypothetical protein